MLKLHDEYQSKGYIVFPGIFSQEEITALNQTGMDICADKRFGSVKFEDILTIHYPHKVSNLILETMRHPSITRVLIEVIGPNVKCMQSMFFVKRPGKPGHAWHQDEAYVSTGDCSLTGVWIALDDATVENGCLWVIPGSHQPRMIWPMRDHGTDEFDVSQEAYGFPYRAEDAVPVEVQAGSVIFFHGYLLHRSLRNRSASSYRRSIVYHYMNAEMPLPWDCSGRVAPTTDNRDIVMVAGEDPYAWKGLQNHHTTFLRRERVSEGLPWYIDPSTVDGSA